MGVRVVQGKTGPESKGQNGKDNDVDDDDDDGDNEDGDNEEEEEEGGPADVRRSQ